MPNYNYSNIGMSPIRRRTPIGMNINAFADAVTKLDAKYQNMAQQQSAIDMAIGQLPVNSAEDEWRMNLADEIRQQINSVENPNDRYLTAIKSAGQIMSRPDVIGRIRAQAEYDNFVKQTQARTDIGQDVKDWAIKNNPYKYEDKRDSSGRIIGGITWAADRTPVSTVPLNAIIEQARKWVNADAGGGVTDISFIDENGKPTSDINKGVFGLHYKKDGKWETLSSEKIQQAINAAIETTPGAKESLQQDYDVAKWKYDNMTAEQKKNLVGGDITDDKGFLLSPQDYIAKKVSPVIAAMQYNRQYSDIQMGNGISNYYSAMAKANKANKASSAMGNGILSPYGGLVGAQTLSTPVTVDVSKQMGETYGNLNSKIASLSTLYPNLSQTSEWKRFVANGDYDGLANLANKNMTSNDPAVRANAMRLINEITDEGQIINDYLNGLGKDDADGVRFALAIQTGSELPADNNYTKEFVKNANTLLDGADHAAFVTQNDDQLQRILDRLQCKNVNELKTKFGLDTITHDGHTGIVFRNNSRGLAPLAEAIANDSDEFWSLNNSKLVTFNSDGSVKDDKSRGRFNFNPLNDVYSLNQRVYGTSGATSYFNKLAQTRHLVDWFKTHTAANAVELQKDIMGRIGRATDTRTLNTLGTKSIQLSDLDNLHNAGQLEDSEYNTMYKKIEDNTDMQVLMHDYTQGEMFMVTGGGAMMDVTDAATRKEIGDRIQAIKPSELKYQAGDNDYQVGTIIHIPAKYDKNGDKTEEAISVFVPNLLDSESDSDYKNNSSFRARRRAATASLYAGNIRLANDYPITNITEKGGMYNGRNISYREIINRTDADIIIEDCKKLRDGGQLSVQTTLTAAENVVKLRGEVAAGTPEYDIAVQKVFNEIAKNL